MIEKIPLLNSPKKGAMIFKYAIYGFLAFMLLGLGAATDPMGDCRPLYTEGKYTTAIQCCDEVIRENSSSGAVGFAWLLKSTCLGNLGNIEEAIEAMDEAAKIDSDYTGFSSVLYPRDEKNTTNTAEKNAAVSKLNEAATWNDKGIILAKSGMFDVAIKVLDEAIRLDPNNAGVWNNKGMDLYDQGKYDEAIRAFDEAIRLKPNYTRAQANKADAVNALAQQNKDYVTTQSRGRAPLGAGTATDAWRDCRGLDIEGKRAEAAQCYDEVIRENSTPNSVAFALNQKSLYLYSEIGDLDGAIKAAEEAARIDPQYGQLLSIFTPTEKTRSFARANLPVYNATKADRNSTTSLIYDAADLYARGMYDESLQRYNEAIALDPKNTTARFGKALDLIAKGQLLNVTKTFDEIVELGFDNTIIWEDIAISLWQEHQLYEEAIRCFDRSIAVHDELIKLNSSNASAWNNKGVCLGLQANVDQDGYLYLTLNDDEASFSKSQAHARYREDKWKEALECFEKATQLDPICADAWYNKGMALYALNDGSESIEYYKETVYCFDQALKLQPREDCSRLVDTRYAEVAMRDKLMEMKMTPKDVDRVAAYA